MAVNIQNAQWVDALISRAPFSDSKHNVGAPNSDNLLNRPDPGEAYRKFEGSLCTALRLPRKYSRIERLLRHGAVQHVQHVEIALSLPGVGALSLDLLSK